MVIAADGGREVARATTDTDGRWRAKLPVGGYTLTPQPVDRLMGTASPIEFTVTASGSPANLDVTYDTGIR